MKLGDARFFKREEINKIGIIENFKGIGEK